MKRSKTIELHLNDNGTMYERHNMDPCSEHFWGLCVDVLQEWYDFDGGLPRAIALTITPDAPKHDNVYEVLRSGRTQREDYLAVLGIQGYVHDVYVDLNLVTLVNQLCKRWKVPSLFWFIQCEED
jgi:hypothetical protein